MNKISIHRALTRIKTLNERIQRASSSTVFVAVAKGTNNLVVTDSVRNKTGAAVQELITSGYQSVLDLIQERNKIKSLVILSNATTPVTIAGVEMTVAEAIEQKTSIEYKKVLLSQMRHQYLIAQKQASVLQQALEAEIRSTSDIMVGKESQAKVTTEQLAMIEKSVSDRIAPVLIDPLSILEKITALETEIQDFEGDVDSILSESNASTFIDV